MNYEQLKNKPNISLERVCDQAVIENIMHYDIIADFPHFHTVDILEQYDKSFADETLHEKYDLNKKGGVVCRHWKLNWM